jgi:hypothetical protein
MDKAVVAMMAYPVKVMVVVPAASTNLWRFASQSIIVLD